MNKIALEAVLRDPLTAGRARSDSDLDGHPFHQLKTKLHVPPVWVTEKAFDAVEFRFVGMIRTRILFTTCRENVSFVQVVSLTLIDQS